jgi:hypothetical protein
MAASRQPLLGNHGDATVAYATGKLTARFG